jgi:prepilin-type N-terminal cleavage/methylation domain-containing protein
MKMFRKDEGFTLVELMVVVLIIGILVAIAIPVFNAASASARLKTCQGNMRTIEGAVEQWLAADPTNARATTSGSGWIAVLVGPSNYIKSEPLCPTAKASYTYNTVSLQAVCGEPAPNTHPHF